MRAMDLGNYKAIVFDLGGTLMEYEIMPVVLFDEAMSGWNNIPDIREAIEVFFSGIGLKAKVFDYSKKIVEICKKHGVKIACLTDLPSGMPDSLFRDAVPDIIKLFDLYVSSQTCGYRKPNPAGLEYIAENLSIDVRDILFIGDEDKDRQTAENAGCDFVHINEFRKCEAAEVSEKDFEKKKELFLNQKKTLDSFLKTGAISQVQYDKSYGDLVKKMGMENVAEKISGS